MSVAVVVGVLLGAVDSVVNHIVWWLDEAWLARSDRSPVAQAADFASFFLDAGWFWAASAVLAGWLAAGGRSARRGVPAAMLAGPIALIVATVVYYASNMVFVGDTMLDGRTRLWAICGLVLGPPLGAVGAAIRQPGWIGALASLVVPAGAVLNMQLYPPQVDSPMAAPVLVIVHVGALAVLALAVARLVRPRSVSAAARLG